MNLKKTLLSLLALVALSAPASALENTLEVGYSSATNYGIFCTSGTVIQLNANLRDRMQHGVAGYRLQNQGAEDVWYGFDVNMTTATAAGDDISELGTKLQPGDSSVEHVDKVPGESGKPTLIPLYCQAADASGADSEPVQISAYGR